MSSIQYRPEIDGLRAIAVIPVVLFHFNKDWLPGGYIGVDVFFVISGYLITLLILNDYQRGSFSFANFWARRVRRILPALITVVLATLGVGSLISYSAEINDMGSQAVASLLSFANISYWLSARNYWGQAAENSLFLHTWSLSVEEQFYLFFPLLLILGLRFMKNGVAVMLLVLSLASVLLFIYGVFYHPAATFYLLPTRAWELGTGAVLAVLICSGRIKLKRRPILAFIALCLILLSCFLIDDKQNVSPFVVVPVVATAFILASAVPGRNMVAQGLSAAPMVYIGRISYSLYLWHWPVLLFSRQLAVDKGLVIHPLWIMALIVGLSAMSYHWIEKPTRRHPKAVPAILLILLVSVGLSYGLKTGDFAEDTSAYNDTLWYGNVYSVSPDHAWPEAIRKRMEGITVIDSSHVDKQAFLTGGIQKLYGGPVPDIVVLGDSHALTWAKVLDEIAEEQSTSIAFFSSDGIPPFFPIPPRRAKKGIRNFSAEQKYQFDLARFNALTEWRPRVVIMVSRWSTQDPEEIQGLVEYIGEIGSKLVLIEQPPELFFGDRNTPQYLSYMGLDPIPNMRQTIPRAQGTGYESGVRLLEALAKAHEHCIRIPVADLYLEGDDVWVLDSKHVLYTDNDHLSQYGAMQAKSRLAAVLAEIGQ